MVAVLHHQHLWQKSSMGAKSQRIRLVIIFMTVQVSVNVILKRCRVW